MNTNTLKNFLTEISQNLKKQISLSGATSLGNVPMKKVTINTEKGGVHERAEWKDKANRLCLPP